LTSPNHSSTPLCHPDLTRALTLRECARCQDFPDEWSFMGSPAAQYRQVGNAVPIRLAEACATAVAELLDEIHAEGPGEGGLPRFRLDDLRRRVRPRAAASAG
jgi:DNA (cytosine-5)-methyltransferase 1